MHRDIRGATVAAVLFDMYGTIMVRPPGTGPEGGYLRFFYGFLSERGLDTAFESFAGTVGAGARTSAGNSGDTKFERSLDAQCRTLGVPLEAEELTSLADGLCRAWQESMVLDPDFIGLVKCLREDMGIRCGLLTNFDHPPHIHRTLGAFGISSAFDAVVVSGEEGIDKPDPRIFHTAHSAVGAGIGETLYVGDSYVDYRGSFDAGMLPVLVRRDGWKTDGHTGEEAELEAAFARGEFLLVRRLAQVAGIAARGTRA